MLIGIVICAVFIGLTVGSADAEIGTPPHPTQSPIAIDKVKMLRARFDNAAINYLEDAAGKKLPYLSPSKIDPRFTIAFYVNTNRLGTYAQRMWVLQRDRIGGSWTLALWDKTYWRQKGLPSGLSPPYSWPVSTGRHYRGDPKSGPTPRGVFAIDERKYRIARGYASRGMINVIYIDLHYSSGRRSGVAFHGTTRGRYRHLGRIDSHGCIRMTQTNARSILDRLQGRDGVLSNDLRWGDVPRFWRTERAGKRFGYTRDGSMHTAIGATPAQSTLGNDRKDSHIGPGNNGTAPDVLTKQGFRAIAVIFGS